MPVARKHDQLPLDLGILRTGEITSALLAYLQAHGFTVWRQNTSGIYNQAASRWRKTPPGAQQGAGHDRLSPGGGVFISVEVKAGRDQLRDDQRQFLNELKQAGGVAFVAYDFAQFQQSFEGRGLRLSRKQPTSP